MSDIKPKNYTNLTTKLKYMPYVNTPKSSPKEPCYNANEVAKMLGYSSSKSLRFAILNSDKDIPKPDFLCGRCGKKAMWGKSTIDHFLKRTKQ
jgi:hypothetical protein